MKIIKNELKIKRNAQIGSWTSLAAMAILGLGMYISFTRTDLIVYSLVALFAGFTLTQIGMYMGNKYGRSPRPDEKLDAGLKGMQNEFSIYHYTTPVSHLLVGPAGVWVLMPYHQRGQVTFRKNRWQMSGGGFMQGYMRIFGQEGLGRPDDDVAGEVSALKKYLSKQMDAEEIPAINAVMVFTSDGVEIDDDAQGAPVPALKVKQLKEFIRKKSKEKAVTPEVINKIKSIFGGK